MLNTTKVTYKHTHKAIQANQLLREISKYPTIACDFEVASKYTDQERAQLQAQLDNEELPHLTRMEAKAKLHSTALDHPSHTQLTHLSIAISDSEAYVFILDNPSITKRVLQYLVTTPQKQIWHNATFDLKHVLYYTGKFPQDFEDTQIFMKTLINHVDVHKATTRLKDLCGHEYGAWGISEDNFALSQMYEPHVLLYAATDACATLWLWDRLVSNTEDPNLVIPSEPYSPWDQLPDTEPRSASYPEAHFYYNTAKHLIRDTVRIMMNGLPIDLGKVTALETHLASVLKQVEEKLEKNPLIKEFQKLQYKKLVSEYKKDRESKLKSPEDYLKPFKHNDPTHRSYFMYVFSQKTSITPPKDLLPTGVPKWSANLVKKLSSEYPPLKRLLDGTIEPNSSTAQLAMQLLAEHKAALYNEKYLVQIKNPEVTLPAFNPASSTQKQALFAWLNVPCEATSKKTGLASWGRDQIERINKETDNEFIKDFTQSFIDYSFAAIVKNNFIEAFYNYTVDNVLHGQYKLLGAKSGRFTSSSPNMLNTPSTGSIFAKPIKECFIAPEDFVVAAIDYSALEDRVMANLSRDENKINIFLKDLDGHCLNAYGYFKNEIAQHMELTGDTLIDVKKFFELTETNKELKAIRQKGKPATFGLSYGSYPPKVSATLKIPLHQAEQIFNSYHNELYPGITDYRENYVLKRATEKGYIHLGLGFNLHTDNPESDIRTLNNATCQVWSILTALTINKLHQLIDSEGLQDDIKVTSTIYDSIYFVVRKDPEVIQWLNNHIIPIMEQDFMEDQIVRNSADLEIGLNWASLHKLSHNAPLEEIQQLLEQL